MHLPALLLSSVNVGYLFLQPPHAGKAAADLEDQTKLEQRLYSLIWALMKTEHFLSTNNVRHAIVTSADCTEVAFKEKYAPDSKGQPPVMTRLLSKVRPQSKNCHVKTHNCGCHCLLTENTLDTLLSGLHVTTTSAGLLYVSSVCPCLAVLTRKSVLHLLNSTDNNKVHCSVTATSARKSGEQRQQLYVPPPWTPSGKWFTRAQTPSLWNLWYQVKRLQQQSIVCSKALLG